MDNFLIPAVSAAVLAAGACGWFASSMRTRDVSGREQQERRQLHREMETLLSTGRPFGMLLVSVGNLADISRIAGWKAKGRVMDELLARMRRLLPKSAVCGVLRDSDAFALLPDCGEDDLSRLSLSVRADIQRPYPPCPVVPKIRIGVLLHGKDAAETVPEILRSLDLAVGAAEAGGIAKYDPALRREMREKFDIISQVSSALDGQGGSIDVFFQPRVALRDGKPAIVSAEALLHWTGDGHVAPDRIFGAAKETGRIPDLSDFIIEKSCMAFKEWLGRPNPPTLTLNASRLQLADGFAASMRRILSHLAIPAHDVGVEIPQNEIAGAPPAILREIGTLAGLGVKVVVDGWSGGPKLPVPVHMVKISLLGGMSVSRFRELALAARALGMKVVAVGVESKETALEILSFADGVQGWCCSRPVPAKEFARLLDRSEVLV